MQVKSRAVLLNLIRIFASRHMYECMYVHICMYMVYDDAK